MLVCTACLHVDDRAVDHCPACGQQAFAHATNNGDLVSVPAEAGIPCQSCFETDHDLKLRYYRRVLGLVFMDRIWGEAGYFCGRCRRRHFAKNMAFTLVLGWWGLIAALFRNPYAISVNMWALFRPPFGAAELGAMNANEIRREAEEERRREQRLADVYMRMPGWMETLSDDDITKVLMNVDYYAVLEVSRSASHREIRDAWRLHVKAHHPDRVGASGHERSVSINDAWQVLGDERLRHAYDHREELLAFLQDAEAAASEFEQDDENEGSLMVLGCIECRLGFETFDDAADHVDAVHPHSDYQDVLVHLVDDHHAQGDSEAAPSVPRWRCKACPETFAEYHAALEHADLAHPDRVTVDPRHAVEAV